ncbi:MAG TPA: S53 family serine peptidase [Aliidongia sp.]|nr:S53 family serine peptidase [Aliidongia sp.]
MRVSYLALAVVVGAFAGTSGAFAADATVVGQADPNSIAQFNVFLPLTHQDALNTLLAEQTDPQSASYHKWLTPAQFKDQFGPSKASVKQAKAILTAAGLTVTEEKTQSLSVQGPVALVQKFINAELQVMKTTQGSTKLGAKRGTLTTPSSLAALGGVIPEFAPHLSAHVHSKVAVSAAGPTGAVPGLRLSTSNSFYYPVDMRETYHFPSFTTQAIPTGGTKAVQIDGAGATIGIVISSTISPTDLAREFNSTVSTSTGSDVQAYAAHTTVPVPTVLIDPVLGGSGAFNPNTDDAGEASLDTQMSLGTAPGAKEIVYDMPDLTDAAIVAAYTQVDEENRVDIVSSSFGECELDFTAAANNGVDLTGILQTFHDLFLQGNAQGITFVASSGDNGAAECTTTAFDSHPTNGTNFILGVGNPASDPAVTGVGGTNLQSAATPTANDAAYLAENANFDPRVPADVTIGSQTFTVGNNTWGSGGGISAIFAKPSYQSLVTTGSKKMRTVPDVSLMMGGCPGDADLDAQDCTALPRSAAIVWIGGVPNLLIGTSSSAPQFAGVLAHAVQLGGARLGNVNPLIYSLSALQTAVGGANAPSAMQYFHRTITGNNNGYTVKPGDAYSEVLGNSTLVVNNFLGLQFAPLSGTPNTASNP